MKYIFLLRNQIHKINKCIIRKKEKIYMQKALKGKKKKFKLERKSKVKKNKQNFNEGL